MKSRNVKTFPQLKAPSCGWSATINLKKSILIKYSHVFAVVYVCTDLSLLSEVLFAL